MRVIDVAILIAFILAAYFVAVTLSPAAAGVFAALPVRLALSLFAISSLGSEVLKQAILGSFIGLASGAIFLAVLYLALTYYSINLSFAIAATVSLLFATVVYILKYGA